MGRFSPTRERRTGREFSSQRTSCGDGEEIRLGGGSVDDHHNKAQAALLER